VLNTLQLQNEDFCLLKEAEIYPSRYCFEIYLMMTNLPFKLPKNHPHRRKNEKGENE
jgi:hypothetical protein